MLVTVAHNLWQGKLLKIRRYLYTDIFRISHIISLINNFSEWASLPLTLNAIYHSSTTWKALKVAKCCTALYPLGKTLYYILWLKTLYNTPCVHECLMVFKSTDFCYPHDLWIIHLSRVNICLIIYLLNSKIICVIIVNICDKTWEDKSLWTQSSSVYILVKCRGKCNTEYITQESSGETNIAWGAILVVCNDIDTIWYGDINSQNFGFRNWSCNIVSDLLGKILNSTNQIVQWEFHDYRIICYKWL